MRARLPKSQSWQATMSSVRTLCISWLRDRHRLLLLAALLVASVNFATAFTWAVPRVVSPETASSWAVDTIAPVPPLTEAYHRFTRRGTDPVVYPLLHYLVLSAVYSPYLAIEYLSGNFRDPTAQFPYGVADPERFFRHLTLIAHLVSLLMALGIVVLVYAITRALFTPRAAALSAFLTALLAPLAYYAKTSNLDVPYLFWMLLGVWHYIQAVQGQRLRNYLMLGVCVALAVASKDQAYGFFVLTPVALAFAHAQSDPRGWPQLSMFIRALFTKPMLFGAMAAVICYALVNNLIFGGWDGFLRHIDFARTFYRENLMVSDPERHALGAQLKLLWDALTLLAQMFGPVTLTFALAGMCYAARQRQWFALSLLLFPLAYYATVLAVAGVVLPRYMLGPALLFLPFAANLIDRLMTRPRVVQRAATLTFLVAVLWQTALSAHINYTLLNDSRYRMEAWIRENLPTGSVIESQVQERYLPHISDRYHYSVVGNAMDVITYDVVTAELTPGALEIRQPRYILVMTDVGLTGDPARMSHPAARTYFQQLLDGQLGYQVLARFETPALLPYRQITAGTQPTTILLGQNTAARKR